MSIVLLAVLAVVALLLLSAFSSPTPSAEALRASMAGDLAFVKIAISQLEKLSAQLAEKDAHAEQDQGVVSEHLAFARAAVERAEKARDSIDASREEIAGAHEGIHEAMSRLSKARGVLRSHGIDVDDDDHDDEKGDNRGV